MRLSFTLLIYSCMFIIIETLHDQSFSLTSEDRLQTTSYRVPEDQGTGVMTSQCMKLVLMSICSCALIVAIVIHINVCAGYMCFVKL